MQKNSIKGWTNYLKTIILSIGMLLITLITYSNVAVAAYEYQYAEQESYWDNCWLKVPCAKWCTKWGVPYPCGIATCRVLPYPCRQTRQITLTGKACRGSGGRVAELLTSLPQAGSKLPDTSTPVADPLTASGDTLYSIYRKGLITRHVTRNGRVLAEVALEKVACFKLTNSSFSGLEADGFPTSDLNSLKASLQDQQFCTANAFLEAVKVQIGDQQTTIYKELIFKHAERIGFDPNKYDKSGFIDVLHSDGAVIKIPIGNVRYSEELTAGSTTSEKLMWSPIIAPIKVPGYSNHGYYVVSGNDDNALYYSGGLALATFSLEVMYGVSQHSIKYARRLMLYFLSSEMWEGNGYIVRKPGFFNSSRNRNGEPIIQGASAEELLGLFLGITYYLKAENPTHPLYKEATRLRDDVLRQVSKGYVWNKYEHPFMNSSKDPSYGVKFIEFPLVATKEYAPGALDFTEQLYISTLTVGSGDTRPGGNWYTFGKDANFQDYMIFLTSMILVLDGNIPEDKKEWFAKVYMEHVIKASKTAGPDIEKLWDNQYMAVVARLVNKYLNDARDSTLLSDELRSIWGGHFDGYNRMVGTAALPMPTPVGRSWQHNLPLSKNPAATYEWKEHNPNNGIGRQFVWRYENNQRFNESFTWFRNNEGKWLDDFPGWHDYGNSWFSPSDQATEFLYKSSQSKGYKLNKFLEQEIIASRNSNDNQVEGTGLGLLFLRMLLTHIDPVKFPPPEISDKDTLYPVLPYIGAEPMSPQLMHNAYRYSSKTDNACGPFEVRGDQDDALRIITIGSNNTTAAKEFIVAYAVDDEKLELKHGFLANGSVPTIGRGVYLDSKGTLWKRFDKASLISTVNNNGENLLIIAERAEGGRSYNPFSGFLRRSHWLRMSLWKVPLFANGRNPNPVLLDTWESEDRYHDGVKEIDMALVGHDHVVVINKTRDDKGILRTFNIENKKINLLHDKHLSNSVDYDSNVKITSAYDNLIIYTLQNSSGWWFRVSKWDRVNLVPRSRSSTHHNELLDMTTIENNGKYYLIIAVNQNDYLRVYSYEILPDGTFVPKGDFDTKQDGLAHFVGREAGYERASITEFKWDNKAGFVVAAKGVAREILNINISFLDRIVDWVSGPLSNSSPSWKKSAKGLKVVYGQVLDSGKPSIETSNVLGSGKSSAMSMLDVSGHMSDRDFNGVLTAHKTKKDHCFFGLWCEQYLGLTFWQYRDIHQDQRW